MNRSYRLVFNRSMKVWQAVSEHARGAGKGSGALKKSVLAVSLSLSASAAFAVGGDIIDGAPVTYSVSGDVHDFGGQVDVGNSANGSLTISNGQEVRSTHTYVGNSSGVTGEVTVTGADSKFVMSGTMSLGNEGSGTLNIRDSGYVFNTGDGYIGAGGTGTVTVSGPGSSWNMFGALYVADSGTGSLTVEGGATVNPSGDIVIGLNGQGTVIVTGAGSRLTTTANLGIATFAAGELTISNGGFVHSNTALVGLDSSATGTITVTGAGSEWENRGTLQLGGNGAATLTVADGAKVSTGDLILAQGNKSGRLNLRGTEGARGVLETGGINAAYAPLQATVQFNGGILRATQNNATFMNAFAINSVITTGAGAFVDTNGFNIGFTTPDMLTGTGSLTKLGAGTLSIAGRNNYDGSTTISEGTLQFTTYNQIAGQSLMIGANGAGAGQYGQLRVTGTANFNPNASIVVDVATVSTLAVGNVLTDVIKADGSLVSNGFAVTDNSALFNFEAVRANNSVDLKVTANSTTGSGIRSAVAGNGNASALGAAAILDGQLNAAAGGDMGTVVNALGQLSNNRDVSRAVGQTLPLVSGTQSVQSSLSSFQSLVQNRNAAGGSGTGLSSGDALSNKQAWAKGFGSRAKQDDRNDLSGFTADSWGLAFGADAQVAAGARFGLAYGYANTSVNGNTGLTGTAQRSKINSHIVSAYGSKEIGNNRTFSFQADVGVSNNDSSRQLNFGGLNRTATADYRTYSAHAGATLAQDFAVSAQTTVTPSVRADYTWLKAQRYSETGAAALNLNVDSQKTDAFVLGTDVRLQHRFTPASKFEANFGVGYDTINKRGNIVAAYAGAPGQSFVTNGVDHSPWLVRGGIGYSHKTVGGTEILVRYDAEGRSDYLNHTASVKASWNF